MSQVTQQVNCIKNVFKQIFGTTMACLQVDRTAFREQKIIGNSAFALFGGFFAAL